jgi:F0F1-type ATP synthase assembly protein I
LLQIFNARYVFVVAVNDHLLHAAHGAAAVNDEMIKGVLVGALIGVFVGLLFHEEVF